MASFTAPTAGNKVAMSASSDELEASIALFATTKEGDVTSSPSLLVDNQRLANRFLLAVGKVLPFASLLLHGVAMRASSDELEASIASFSAAKECDVASPPSPLANN